MSVFTILDKKWEGTSFELNRAHAATKPGRSFSLRYERRSDKRVPSVSE